MLSLMGVGTYVRDWSNPLCYFSLGNQYPQYWWPIDRIVIEPAPNIPTPFFIIWFIVTNAYYLECPPIELNFPGNAFFVRMILGIICSSQKGLNRPSCRIVGATNLGYSTGKVPIWMYGIGPDIVFLLLRWIRKGPRLIAVLEDEETLSLEVEDLVADLSRTRKIDIVSLFIWQPKPRIRLLMKKLADNHSFCLPGADLFYF